MGDGRFAAVAVASAALILGSLPGLSVWQTASPPLQAAPAVVVDGEASALAAVIPAVPGQLHVTTAGDYSTSAAAAGVLARIGTIAPDLHFALGDLSYGATGAEQSWCDLVTSNAGAGFPFELVSGNHESNGQNGNINDFAACLPNQLPGLIGTYGRQYYVDVPQQDPVARFIMISPGIPFTDATWNYSAGSTRYNWTSAAIDGARTAAIPWVVVGMHTPCLSIGQYSCVAGADITNLMVTKKVDLVMNGHEHIYQRSKQLSTGTGCTGLTPDTYDADCVRDADNTISKGAGTVFTTVGTGGVALRDVNTGDPEAPYFAAYSGLNASPSHGLLDLQFTATSLTGRFIATAGSFQDDFSITPGTGNASPVASFTSSCTALACSFDGSASSDPDGTITSHAWDFGDGSAGNGATASRTYATAGTYTVTLTVTDNAGATASTVRQVTVGATPLLASDAFDRTVVNGLGSADIGGPWTFTGSSSAYSVSGGTGRIRISAPSVGNNAYLGSVSSTATDLYLVVATDKPATGSGLYVSVSGRRISGIGEYRAKLSLTSTGSVNLTLVRTSANGAETTIATGAAIPGLNYAVGDRLGIRLQVTGTSPTTVRARVWELGTAEPSSWQRTVTDSTAALQAAGSIGVMTYLSGSATNAPITVLLDDVRAAAP
ncbi:PKD domain-containing protein [Arthrobacter sp. S39]|uniref:PKD domain-containing protein n=1 Tax=Arthrobacter sp. S39 TaxID=2509720 RepID=UPI0013EF9203|nr:PKD domain-containing protein [Arthrobacter sp. S39]